MKRISIPLAALASVAVLTGCGDNMSKLAKSNPQVYQKVNHLAQCAGVQIASGQLANAQMAQDNAASMLMVAGMAGAQFGVTEKDLEKITLAEADKWKGTTINNPDNLLAAMKECTAFTNSLANQ